MAGGQEPATTARLPAARPSTVVRQNVTSFSEWTVGSVVGPTAIELTGFTAQAVTPSGIVVTLGAVLMGIGWLLGRRYIRLRRVP